jgi:3',5'-cyclic AMP phosphodiesterase CpdA
MKRSITILIFLGFTLFLSSIIVTGSNNIRENTKGITSSSWHFVALGDSRQQHGDWDYDNNKYFHDNSSNPTRAALITSVVENNPNMEFIIHTGDLVNSGGEQDDWNRYYEDIENATKANVTIYNAIGNHELYTYALEPSQWGPADEDYSTYLENVELPGNERYYSFDFMNQIHFVFINTEEDWTGEFSITTDQNDWLINDLTTNTLEFIVAVFHRPCYSVRDAGRVQDAKDVRLVLDPIFIEYGVDLVFSGHDHQY